MRPERWQKIESIYQAALQRDGAERHAFVVEACGDDDDLRIEVKSLLAADVKAESFLEVSAVEIEARSIAVQAPASLVGRQLGRYQILASIDSGGMGEVYRAKDLSLNRSVAIKVLPQHLAQDSEGRARFLREAKAVAALSHPNVLAIHDFGTEHGVWFAVTELLEGETLRARIQRSPLPWQDAAAIGAAVADGLAAVHGNGFVHRDLKPENIFLTAGGGVKILDFGIARMNRAPLGETLEETETAYTTPGTVLGTVGYMSPEQLSGRPAEAPSDIFSLGCVLHEALTGETAFGRATTAETLAAILRDDPPTLAETNRDIPPELDRLVRRCLDKQPEKRFSRAQDLSSGLREILDRKPMPQRRAATIPSRRSLLLATAIVVVFALTGLWAWRQSGVEDAIDSLAILPLVNDSGDPGLDYLSDGITESLINSLSRLQGLKVSARTTVFHFKGKEVDVAAIQKQLGVRAIVTGKMTFKDDELTVQADLIDAVDGSQLWGQRYHRKLSELPAVEQEIARQISSTLRPQLTSADENRIARRHPENTEVYQLYLQGRFFLNRATPESFQTAVGYFNKALEKDPAYALAYAGLADAYQLLGGFGVFSMRETHPKARTAATKALEIDETLVEAHAALASVLADYYWDWPEADKHYQRAFQLEPNYAMAHQYYAYYLARFGRLHEAVAEARRATELEPYSPIASSDFGGMFLFTGEFEQAAAELRKTLEMDPDYGYAHFLLALALAGTGRHEEALQEMQRSGATLGDLGPLMMVQSASGRKKEALATLQKAEKISRQQYIPAPYFATAYAALGDRERTIEWLEKAYEERHWLVTFLNVGSTYDLVREDPRFKDLVSRIGVGRP